MIDQTKRRYAIGTCIVVGAIAGAIAGAGITFFAATPERVWCNYHDGVNCHNFQLYECRPNPPLKNGLCS